MDSGDPIKKKSGLKVPGTGLTLYESNEKTPTGQSNSFSSSGLTPDDLLAYAEKYDLPTTSNKEFQQAQFDLLNRTAKGRKVLEAMVTKYGLPKSGNYADNMLGARTLDMMMATPNMPDAEIIKLDRVPGMPAVPGNIDINNFERPSKYKGYGPWVIRSRDSAVPDRSYDDYDEYASHLERGRARGINTMNSYGKGVFSHPNTNQIIPQSVLTEQDYDNDVFAGIDLPNEETNIEGIFNNNYLPSERLRSPLGIIDKETGKYIPYRMDPYNNAHVLYLQKMVKEHPELFDLNKQAWRGRKITNEKNQFNPENNPLDAKRWGNNYNLMYERNR